MKLKTFFLLITASCFIGLTMPATSQPLLVTGGVKLPENAVLKNELISSLNGLLTQKERPVSKNEYILQTHALETAALINEIKAATNNEKQANTNLYKNYLSNAVNIDSNNWVIQLQYMTVADGQPVLKAAFRLMARHEGHKFLFYAPLKQYTQSWHSKSIHNTTFYYKSALHMADVKAYQKKLDFYNQKLNAPASPTHFYYCDNLTEALQLVGVDYMLDYNGMNNNNLTVQDNNTSLLLNGWTSNPDRFDPHDLWHDRLRSVLSNEVINRPVDEGCAYLYGGSWGLTWPQVISSFKAYASAHPEADWAALYEAATNYTNGSKPLKVPFAINALIVQQLESKKGFLTVMKLLSCGSKETGNANYFTALAQTTGVTRADFNAYVWQLIRNYKL